MLKKKILSIMCIIAIFLNLIPGFSLAESKMGYIEYVLFSDEYYNEQSGALYEKDNRYALECGENVVVGNTYYMSIYVRDFDELQHCLLPIHFNNNVLRLASFTDDEGDLSNTILSDADNSASFGLLENPELGDYWNCATLDRFSINYPRISNDYGLALLYFKTDETSWLDIQERTRLITLKFKAISSGSPDIRAATKAEDVENGYDATSPLGYRVANLRDGTITEYVDISLLGRPSITKVTPAEYSSISSSTSYTADFKTCRPDDVTLKLVGYSRPLENNMMGYASFIEPIQGTVSGSTARFSPITFAEEGEYTLHFEIEDSFGYGDTYKVKYFYDCTAPAVVEGLTADGDVRKIILSWNQSVEADTAGYNVYRSKTGEDGSFELIKQIRDKAQLGYTDSFTALNCGTYYYYITAVDEVGLESEPSNIASAEAIPNAKPYIESVTPGNNSLLNGTESIKVSAVCDGGTIDKMEMFVSTDEASWSDAISPTTLSGGKGTFSLDTTKYPDGKLYLKFVAWSGNLSSDESVPEYYVDNTAPDKVEGLKTIDIKETSISLTWNRSNESDFSHYIVQLISSSGTSERICSDNSFTFDGLTPGTEYGFRVIAVDYAGNRSEESDRVDASTLPDTTGPVVLSASPESKTVSASQEFQISFRAEDESGVVSYKLQKSDNGLFWEDYTDYKNISSNGTLVTIYHSLNSADFEVESGVEEEIYFRAIVRDINGNESSTSISVPKVKIIVDNEAPEAPVLSATGGEGFAKLTWEKVDGAVSYTLYRTGKTEPVATGLTGTSYSDKGLTPGKYYYYMVAVDAVGNVSEKSPQVEARVLDDKTSPTVTIVNGGYVSSSAPVKVSASDNGTLSEIKLEYMASSESTWTVIGEKSVSGSSATAEFTSKLPDGTYMFKATATDINGNIGTTQKELIVDTVAPVIENENAEATEGGVNVSWSCYDEDINSFEIYYKEIYNGTETGYSRYTKFTAGSDDDFSRTISNLTKYKRYYTIKIVAYDNAGNSSEKILDLVFQDKVLPIPTAVITATSAMQPNVAEDFDGSKSRDDIGIVKYEWDFGDGTTATGIKLSHAYNAEGKYTVTLTVTNAVGKSHTVKKTITVAKKLASATVRVLDSENSPISDATVTLKLGENSRSVVKTDAKGYATIKAEKGTYSVVASAAGYIPQTETISVNYDTTKINKIALVKQNIIISSIEWKEKDGKYQYDVVLEIGNEIVHHSGTVTDPSTEPIVFDAGVASEYDFAASTNKNSDVNATVVIYDFNNIGSEGFVYKKESGGTPQNIVIVVTAPDDALWVGNEFDVQMTVSNQAAKNFELRDGNINLSFNPESGIAIVNGYEDNGYEGSLSCNMSQIPGLETDTYKWKLKGTKSGEYSIIGKLKCNVYDTETKETVASPDIIAAHKDENGTYDVAPHVTIYGNDGLIAVIEGENKFEESSNDRYVFRAGIRNVSKLPREISNLTLEGFEPVPGFNSYIVTEDGFVEAMKPGRLLRQGETLYSNYYCDTIKTNVQPVAIKAGLVKALNSTKDRDKHKFMQNGSPVLLKELVMEYSLVDKFSFHQNDIEVFRVNKDGRMLDGAHISAYSGETIKLAVRVTDQLPGNVGSTPLIGYPIYMDGNDTGLQTKDGGWEYMYYTCPDENEKTSITLSIKSNRTNTYKTNIQIKKGLSGMTGVVYDKTGKLINNAVLYMYDENNNLIDPEEKKYSAQTNADGTYTIDDIVAGKVHTLRIERSGYKPLQTEVTLESGINIVDFEIFKDDARIESLKGDIAKGNIVDNDIIELPKNFDMLNLDVNFNVKISSESGEIAKYWITEDEGDAYAIENKLTLPASVFTDNKVIKLYVETTDGTLSSVRTFTIKHIDTPFDLASIDSAHYSEMKLVGGVLTKELRLADVFDGDIEGKWGTAFAENFAAKLQQFNGLTAEYEVEDYVFDGASFGFDIDWSKFIVPVELSYDMSSYMLKVKSFGSAEDTIGSFNFFSRANEEMGVNAMISSYAPISATPQLTYKYKKGKWDVDAHFHLKSKYGFDYGTYNVDMNDWFTTFMECSLDHQLNDNLVVSISDASGNKPTVKESLDGIVKIDLSGKNGTGTSSAEAYRSSNVLLESTYFYSDVDAELQYLPKANFRGRYEWGFGQTFLGWGTNKQKFEEGEFSKDYKYEKQRSLFAEENTDNLLYDAIEPTTLQWHPGGGISLMSLDTAAASSAIANGLNSNTSNKLVALNDGSEMLLFTADDVEGRVDGNFSALKYAIKGSDGSWGTFANVEADDTADYSPDAVAVKDKVVAVWSDMANPVVIEGEGISVGEIEEKAAKELIVSAAVYSGDGWSPAVKLSLDGAASYAPAISSFGDGGAIAVWIQNNTGNIVGNDRNDSVAYSIFDGTSWSEPAIAALDCGIIDEISIHAYDKQVYLAIKKETYVDIDGGRVHHKKLHIVEGGMKKNKETGLEELIWSQEAPKQLVNNEYDDSFSGFMTYNDTVYVVVANGGRLYAINPENRKSFNTDTSNGIENSISSVATEMSVVQNGNNINFVWVANPHGFQKLYANTLKIDGNNLSLSEPVELTDVSETEINKNLSATLNGGNISVAYNKVSYDATKQNTFISDIELYTHSVGAAMAEIVSLTTDDTAPASGETINFTAEVKNPGILDAQNASVVLRRMDTGAEIAKLEGIDLASGETKAVVIPWVVEGITGNFFVEATGVASGISSVPATVEIVAEDIAVETDYNKTLDRLIITVKNIGYADAKNVVLKVYDNEKGEQVGEDTVIEKILRTEQTQISVDASGFGRDDGKINVTVEAVIMPEVNTFAVEDEAAVSELYTENNSSTLVTMVLAKEDMYLGGYVKYLVSDTATFNHSGIAVELLSGNQVVASAVTDADGRFEMAKPLPGTYNVKLSSPVIKNRESIQIVVGDTDFEINTAENPLTVIFGDLDKNGLVNSADLQIISESLGTNDVIYDLNSDGLEDEKDFGLVAFYAGVGYKYMENVIFKQQ